MTRTKRLIAVFIAIIMLTTLVPVAAFAADLPPIEPAGPSGKWTYTYQAGILTITGNGKNDGLLR